MPYTVIPPQSDKDVVPTLSVEVADSQRCDIKEAARVASVATNGLIAVLDLTHPEAMELAQELLKRLAFLQSTSRFLSNIDFINKGGK